MIFIFMRSKIIKYSETWMFSFKQSSKYGDLVLFKFLLI